MAAISCFSRIASISERDVPVEEAQTRYTRLTGRPLGLARIAWFVLFSFTFGLFAMAVPVRLAELRRTFSSLTPAQELILRDLGIQFDFQPVLVFSLEVGIVAAFVAVALLIFAFRSNEWLPMLLSIGGVAYVTWGSAPLDALASFQPFWQRPVNLAHAIGLGACLFGLDTFPDGRFCPPWSRFLVVPYLAFAAAWVAFPGSVFDLSSPYRLSVTSFLLAVFWWLSGWFAQVYRLRRVSAPAERQQTKWIVVGVTLAVFGYAMFGQQRILLPAIGQPTMANIVFDMVAVPLYLCVLFVVPLAFAVSIFRNKLWDVDVVIGRAFVYGTMTAALAGLYIASIGFFQRLFVAITGTSSEAATVLTTLTVAAAFTPVKSQLQLLADRHIKERPDPTRSLRGFGQEVQAFADLMDTRRLTSRALDEAVAAVGASGGAVFLRVDGRRELSSVAGEWDDNALRTVPLVWNDIDYGCLELGPRKDGAAYGERDLAVLDHCASVVARALHLVDRQSARALAVATS